jgi:hypothetical protein
VALDQQNQAVTPRDLEALAGKYRTLARLRARREEVHALGRLAFDDAEGAERRDAFRRVAGEFPGALRELDTSSADVLRAKLAVVEGVIAGRERPVWIGVVIDFHATLREALAVKLWIARRIGRDGAIDEDVVAACKEWHDAWPHRHPESRAVDAKALAIHHHPPGGRILGVVWAELAERHGRPRAELERMVFGPI